jgi:hypothetical protein
MIYWGKPGFSVTYQRFMLAGKDIRIETPDRNTNSPSGFR